MSEVEKIAAGLTKAQRRLWIRTVLAVNATEAQRSAFIAGYNEQECPKPRTVAKWDMYCDGLAVRDALKREVGR